MVTRVAVKSTESLHQPQRNRCCSLLDRLQNYLLDSWYRSQIGHRSQYSVERLMAFRDYHQRTSFVHAVAVCLLSPFPALIVVLAIDAIPLRPPSEGWQANYAFWVRLFFTALFTALGLLFQVKEILTVRTITNVGAFGIALGTSVTCLAMLITVAALWRFPVPFGGVIAVGPFVTVLAILVILAIGPHVVAKSPKLRQQILSQLLILATQGSLAIIYPIFNAIFERLSGIPQTISIVLMPVIKFFTKQIIASAAGNLHEYVGPVVVFSVDLFNVFYIAICMQAATSTLTTLLFIASDSLHVILALRAILHQASTDRLLGSMLALDAAESVFLFELLPLMVRKIFHEHKTSKPRPIRVFAPFPLPMSDESTAFINELAKSKRGMRMYPSPWIRTAGRYRMASIHVAPMEQNKVGVSRRLSGNKQSTTDMAVSKQHQISPVKPVIARHEEEAKLDRIARQLLVSTHSETSFRSAADLSTKATEEVVWDALQALFHTEYLLLVECMECIVPTLYAVYLVLTFHMSVAAYYPRTVSMTYQELMSTVAKILLFAVVEIVGFVGLIVLLRRKFGFSPLYQLAFVLEVQYRSLQGHIFVWSLYILFLTIAHAGVDFSTPFK